MHAYMHTGIHIHINSTFMHTHVCADTWHMYTQTHKLAHRCTHAHTYTCTHANVYIHITFTIHIHASTHIYTYILSTSAHCLRMNICTWHKTCLSPYLPSSMQFLPTRTVTVHKAAKVVGPRIGGEDVTRLQRQKHWALYDWNHRRRMQPCRQKSRRCEYLVLSFHSKATEP